MILPGLDGIGAQPPPDGNSADGDNNTLPHNVPLKVFPTETRQRNTQPRRQFAGQRDNRHPYSSGNTGQAARILVDRPAQPNGFQKTASSIYSRFGDKSNFLAI